jgi:cystathionine beta-lyase
MAMDFDQQIMRENTGSLKFDGRNQVFGTKDVLPLWVADMDFAVPQAVAEALQARAQHPIFGYSLYPESLYQSLINWFDRRYNWSIERDWIMMAPGVVPSLHAASMAFAEQGEGIIVQPPVYFPFFSAVNRTQRQLLLNPLKENVGRYSLDFELLDAQAAEARMLIFCSPHNPVGRVWSREELEELLRVAMRHNLLILSDDIHADLTYPGVHHQLLANMDGEFQDFVHSNVITAVAPSKTFNIPGLGLSSLIVPNPEHRKRLQQVFDQLQLSNHNPFSIVAFEAAYNSGDQWLDDLRQYLAENRALLKSAIEHLSPLRWIEPEGTYLLWLDCRNLGLDDVRLNQFFIHQCGLGLSPGKLFGEQGSGFMRLNLGTTRSRLQTAMEQLQSGISQFNR